MGFLAIIPAIFELLEKIIGPMVTGGASKIATGLLGISSNPTVEGIMSVITGTVGQLENEKIVQIKAGVQILLAQVQLAEDDNKSGSVFAHWHSLFCYGMTVITLSHFGLAELFNILISLNCPHIGVLAPMDTATLSFIGLVLGGTMLGKTAENVNSNKAHQDDSDDEDSK